MTRQKVQKVGLASPKFFRKISPSAITEGYITKGNSITIRSANIPNKGYILFLKTQAITREKTADIGTQAEPVYQISPLPLANIGTQAGPRDQISHITSFPEPNTAIPTASMLRKSPYTVKRKFLIRVARQAHDCGPPVPQPPKRKGKKRKRGKTPLGSRT